MPYLVGAIYIVIYFFLAMAFFPFDSFRTGGTLIFMAPFPTILFSLVALKILDHVALRSYRWGFIILMCAHYIISSGFLIYYLLLRNNLELALKSLADRPFLFLTATCWYLSGQVIMWVRFYLEVGYSRDSS